MVLSKLRKYQEFSRKVGMSSFFIIPAAGMIILVMLFESAMMFLLMSLIKVALYRDYASILGVIQKIHLTPILEIFPKDSTGAFMIVVMAILVCALAQAVLVFSCTYYVGTKISRIAHNLRISLVKKYFSFGKVFFDNESNQNIVTVANSFTQDLENGFFNLAYGAISFAIFCVYIGVMAILSWRLTVLMLVFIPIMYVIMKYVVDKIKARSIDIAFLTKRMNAILMDILNCFSLIRSSNTEGEEFNKYSKISGKLRNMRINIFKKRSVVAPLKEFLQIGVMLVFVAIIALLGKYTRFDTIKDVSRLAVFVVVLKRASTRWGHIISMQNIYANCYGKLKEITAVVFADEFLEVVSRGEKELERVQSGIEFRNMNFGYKPEVPILKGLNLYIPAHKTVGIVGCTGSGKTTIASLLLRLYECNDGVLFIDGTDVTEFSVESVRQKISYVSQETFLFDDTIRANIMYGINRDISDEELSVYLKKVHLYEFVVAIPDGLSARVGERGLKLSGGEKQRMSILRAILRDSDIVILDEATSALDSVTEKVLHDFIFKEVSGKTLIIIAHRLSTIKHADKIAVLEDGRIVEEGVFNDLIHKKSHFYKYWVEQNI